MDIKNISANIAERLHAGQTRKWTNEPYFNHVKQVAEITAKMGGSPHAVAAAYLHDVLEDTNTSYAELWAELICEGVSDDDADLICSYVWFMTDRFTSDVYPSLNRTKRKQLEAERIVSECDNADKAILKVADWDSNSPSIQANDPDFWEVCLREKALFMIEIYRFIPIQKL